MAGIETEGVESSGWCARNSDDSTGSVVGLYNCDCFVDARECVRFILTATLHGHMRFRISLKNAFTS